MATKIPRIHTVLDPSLYEAVELLARKNGVSLSQEVRDLVRGAIELVEDRGIAAFADERRKTFDRKKALSVAQVRKRLTSARKGK